MRLRLGDGVIIPEAKQPAAEFLLALFDRYVPRCIDLILSGERVVSSVKESVVGCGVECLHSQLLFSPSAPLLLSLIVIFWNHYFKLSTAEHYM